jgi:hypothetical protein
MLLLHGFKEIDARKYLISKDASRLASESPTTPSLRILHSHLRTASWWMGYGLRGASRASYDSKPGVMFSALLVTHFFPMRN